ncbi:MAG TPA: VIT domain-containing protein [Thermoanaerobaculia bacterium]|nr:VIT domain-containing protein [Thermoanaerobaculia bacterium]
MAALCLFMVTIGSGLAGAETGADRRQGLFLSGKNGAVPAPVLGSTVEVKVTGIIARAKVTQIFKNVSSEWVEGIYIFPLPEEAAVDTLRMKVGSRTIRGVIQEKAEARQTYEAAKQQGAKASLVEQQRPDVFTTSVANVGPGETVEVSIELQQVVKWGQGRFSFRFPMVVAPRPGAKAAGLVLPPVLPAGSAPINPFAFHADLYPGFPLASIESPSHAITVEKGKNFQYAVDLKQGVAPADADLVVEWTPAVGREPRGVYYSEEVNGERYSLLMVMPPDTPDAVASRLPRESIFVIDDSGSMSGAKLEQAREALLFGLGKLHPTDWFNVIRFSTTADSVFPASVQATRSAVDKARRWVAGLQIEGGTQMLPALQIAFRNPPPVGLVPQVIFATDGVLEDEPQVVQFLGAHLGSRRLFPVAIGSDPNAHLLGSLAALGGGSFTAIDDVGKVATVMGSLFSKLEAPMLQEIHVDWSDGAAEAWPARIPDLYLGEPLIVTARSAADAGPVSVSGLRGGSSWEDSFPAAADFPGAGIDKLWARQKIRALTGSLREGANAAEVRRAIAELGLRHHLVTDATSLVAVDDRPTAPANVEPVTRVIPVNPPRPSQGTAVASSGEMVEDCITVESESPLLDERRIYTGSTVSQAELTRIPTARDPWAILQSTPGVLTDRINVGGNESGQQSRYVGPGSGGGQAVWSVDGVVVTDMTALGSSPGYYDFDSFEEMNVTTGGSDATVATGGVAVNLVTKRGTNEWRGSSRYLTSNDSLQAPTEGNRIDKTAEQGAEIGGPIVKDHAWAWGSYARSQVDLRTTGGFRDDTTLDDWNVKLIAQFSEANAATVFAWQSDKVKQGRNAGPLRPQETTWDQSRLGPSPTAWKAEDTEIFTSNFYLTGMVSQVNGGFQLTPEGGDRRPFRDANLVWHGSFLSQQVERPQQQEKLDGSTFFNTGAVSHELKYGAGYRTVESSTLIDWPGGGFELDLDGPHLLALSRDAAPKVKTDYGSLYIQDTLNRDRLTANLGLRWDRQGGRNEASSVAANPLFPGLLPAVRYGGQGAGFTWSGVTPRLGLTYALGAERKTLLRASYSRFADQLGAGQAGWLNPLGGLGYRYFLGSQGEPGAAIAHPSGNVNPLTFGFLQSNAVDANLSAPLTDEVLLGVEHALLPEFVVGFNLSYRKIHNLLEAERLVFDASDPFAPELLGSAGRVHQRSDYVERTATATGPGGHVYTVHYWELRPGVTTRNGFYLTNGEREQEYKGASFTFDKRLANRWMMRGNVSLSDWTWRIPGGENQDPTDTVAGGIVNGTDVLQGSGTVSGPKGNVFINARWSYSMNAIYQIMPDRSWGFNVAANLTGREGYPVRYAERINRTTIADNGGLGTDVPILTDPNALRYPDVHVVDLRVEKELLFQDFGLTLGVDLFNALNASYVLQRQGVLAQNGVPLNSSGSVLETLSPRVFRLGARLTFR